jgi:hypothetical protein
MTRHCLLGFSVLLLFLAGCKDDFNPKIPFQQVPVLYCVLSTTYQHVAGGQRAIITATYDVPGVNPSANHTDPTITGAKVFLQVNDRKYEMLETRSRRADSTRYNDSLVSYGNANVSLYPFDNVTLSALLPDGRSLWAHSVIPSSKGLRIVPATAPNGFTTKIDRAEEGPALVIDWDDGAASEHLFFPRLTLTYYIHKDSIDVRKSAAVPLHYVQQGKARVPVYPTAQVGKECEFDLDSFDEFMRSLSEGDTAKSTYLVGGMTFTLTEFDYPLTQFYASVNGYLDQYSVRIDQTTYTDVVGGIGVFGSRMDSQWPFKISPIYIRSFGYGPFQ